jgi:hypothetical protein
VTLPEGPLDVPTRRRILPWPWWRRWIRELAIWPFDLDDGNGDGSPSMAKIIAWIFAFLLCASVIWQLPISGTQLAFAIVVLSAAFGRSMFKAYLNRGSWSTSTATVESRSVQEIVTRRARGGDDATEPT